MCNRDDGEIFELLVHQLLYFLLRDEIDVGCGFVQNDDLILSKDSSDDTDELLLAR
jgi:hypothetical protein